MNRGFTLRIKGLRPRESDALLDFLYEHVTTPEFTCRFHWQKNSLAIWDNRLCVHQAFNDYEGHRRELYRTTVVGEVPA